jgi:hypothetical protein
MKQKQKMLTQIREALPPRLFGGFATPKRGEMAPYF